MEGKRSTLSFRVIVLQDVCCFSTLLTIFSVGSPAVHEKAPLVKSMMLAGPRGTGKKMLVHAMCNETGANLFDLTAANIAGRFVSAKLSGEM